MKQKLLSVLLVLAMALTLLPTAAFAEETATPAVSGYGFVWGGGEHKDDLVEGATTSGDWMGETMYVYFAKAPAANVNLWFQVKVGEHTWGCAAPGGKKTYAFSFLNRGSQWELHPTINGESFDYSGNNVTHATKYMNAGEVTLEVFTPTNAIQGAQETAPTAETLGEAIFTQKITIKANEDVKQTVDPATSGKTKLDAGTVSGAILNQADDAVKNIKVTAKAGTADSDGVIPVALTASATIPTHKNGENKDGVWVGFALAAPEGAAKVKYAFGATADDVKTLSEIALENDIDGKGGKGIAFYANKSDESPKIYAAVQWIPAENDETYTASDVTVYKMDLSEINKPETPATSPLTVAPVTGETDLLGKKANDLQSDIKVDITDGINVTGTSKYVTGYTGWSSVTEDQEGNYIALKLTTDSKEAIQFKSVDGTDNGYKTLDSDGILIWRISKDKDGNVKPIEVKVGKDNFTIDLSGVTLLPKAADGTKVEATTDAEGNTTIKASDTAGKVTVTLPAETTEDLAGNTVKVENKTSFENVTLAQNTDKAVSDVVKTASAGAAVTVTDSEGKEVEVSGAAAITITIKVEEAGTYHVFCIDNDGKVTSFGEYTATDAEKTLTIKSKHLSQYPAVKITEENKAAIEAAAKLVDQDEGKVDGDTPVTPPATGSTYTRSKDAALNKVTISGKADTYYIVQATNAKNSAPGLIYCVKADGSGKAEVRCNASSVLLVLEGTTAEPVFTNGVPSGLTEVKEAPKG